MVESGTAERAEHGGVVWFSTLRDLFSELVYLVVVGREEEREAHILIEGLAPWCGEKGISKQPSLVNLRV